MNLPIFRAKRINSNEYLIGHLKFDRKHNHYSINPIDDENTWHKIEKNTLAIHFPDMFDSQGNKIFASLQEDGRGGSIANYDNKGKWIAMYIESAFMWVNEKDMEKIGTKERVWFVRLKPLIKVVVIGIY